MTSLSKIIKVKTTQRLNEFGLWRFNTITASSHNFYSVSRLVICLTTALAWIATVWSERNQVAAIFWRKWRQETKTAVWKYWIYSSNIPANTTHFRLFLHWFLNWQAKWVMRRFVRRFANIRKQNSRRMVCKRFENYSNPARQIS